MRSFDSVHVRIPPHLSDYVAALEQIAAKATPAIRRNRAIPHGNTQLKLTASDVAAVIEFAVEQGVVQMARERDREQEKNS